MVTLIEYTGKGRPDERWHAARILALTGTSNAAGLEDLARLSTEELLAAARAAPREADSLVHLTFAADHVTDHEAATVAGLADQSMRIGQGLIAQFSLQSLSLAYGGGCLLIQAMIHETLAVWPWAKERL